MAAIVAPSDIGSSDRLGMTLFLATVIHGIVILGISFSGFQKVNEHAPRPMDVIIVHSQSQTAPEDAENIAQFNQEKSGQADDPSKPSSPVLGTSPDQEGLHMQQQRMSQPQQTLVTELTRKLHTDESETSILTKDKSRKEQEKLESREKQLQQREQEIARLTAQVEKESRQYAERPRVHFIDAQSAKSSAEAQYLKKWEEKVEGIGNLSYQTQDKLRGISGKLILNVLLDAKGRVLDVAVGQSSGNRVLDQAAITIVHQSSPFAAFTAEMREKYDQLKITRTWIFNSAGS